MKASSKILLALTAVAALSFAYPASVQAVPITYTYTGNPYTTVSGSYTTSMFVTAMVTLAGPLAPNTPLSQVFPTAFTISDGVQTITNLSGYNTVFFFQTGPTGAITGWNVQVAVAALGGIQSLNFVGAVSDLGLQPNGSGRNSGTPGVWSIQGQVPDTGSTLSLMTLTLMALGLVARRFKRAAA